MARVYVFDLDNALVYTDLLNNESYNYALKQMNLGAITSCKRVTRNIVFATYSHLDDKQKNEIMDRKQRYFVDNINNTEPNTELLNLLKSLDPAICILWTSAEEDRIEAILEHYGISKAFTRVIYSKKFEVLEDIRKIRKHYRCKPNSLIFYEDNSDVIERLKDIHSSDFSIVINSVGVKI